VEEDCGGVRVKEPFPRSWTGITKDPRTGVPGVTLKVAVLLAEV
jgi:hypothetical protein